MEGMMLKLKLQYFGHLMQRADSSEKTLMVGGIGGRRRRGTTDDEMLDGITDPMDVSVSELRELVMEGGLLLLLLLSRFSRPVLCDPINGSPPGSPVPGILQARILEWVAISFSNA